MADTSPMTRSALPQQMDAVDGGAAPAAESSWTIRTLSLIAAAYLGVALVYAVEQAVVDHSGLSLPVAVLAFGGLALVARLRSGVALLLAFSFSAQLVWGAVIDPQPFEELGTLWTQARELAAQTNVDLLYKVASPSAVGLYAVLILVFGDSFEVLRAAVAALWTAQVWFIWRIANEVAELRRHALAAAAVIGLAPSTIVFASLPSADAVFALFASAALYVMLSHRRRGLLESAALSGVLLAAAFLARPVALAYLLGVVTILGFAAYHSTALRPRIRLVGAVLTCIAGFAAAVAPQALLNYHNEGRFSIAPAPSLGYQLLLGTNRESRGRYNDKDIERAGFDRPAEIPFEEADRTARQIALERIADDPLGFAVFAATDKMRELWGGETELLRWSLNTSPRHDRFKEMGLLRWGGVVVDGVYLGFLFAAFLGAARLLQRRGAVKDPIRWLLVYTVLLALALVHVFVEVGGRYHLAFSPLLAMQAPLGATIRLRKAGRKPAASPVLADTPEDADGLMGDAASDEDVDLLEADPDAAPRIKHEILRGTVARLAEKRAEARAAANASRGAAGALIRRALEAREKSDVLTEEPNAIENAGSPETEDAAPPERAEAPSPERAAKRGPGVIEAMVGRLPIAPQKSKRRVAKETELKTEPETEPESAPAAEPEKDAAPAKARDGDAADEEATEALDQETDGPADDADKAGKS